MASLLIVPCPNKDVKVRVNLRSRAAKSEFTRCSPVYRGRSFNQSLHPLIEIHDDSV
jgi:hypothetical protein